MKFLFPFPLLLVAGVAAAQSNVIDLAPITVTASSPIEAERRRLRPVTIVTREEINHRQPSSTADLLRLLPGINIKRTGGRAGQTSVFMRGTDPEQVLVLVNGVPANSITTGAFDWRSISPQQIQRMEIERGARSTRYGSAAIGGVIRIYTRDPIGWHMQLEAGSHGTVDGVVGYGGQSGALDYAISFAAATSDGINATDADEPDRDGYDSRSLTINTNYRLSATAQLGLNIWVNHDDLEFDAGSTPPDARMETENAVVSLDFAQSLTDAWRHDLQIGYTADDMVTHASYHSDISARRIDINWQHELQLTRTQQLTAGVSWQHSEAEANSVYDETTNNMAVFAGWQGHFGAHTLDLGLRYDEYEQFGGETTGSIAWAYAINSDWRVNASYATAFRAPTFNDLYWQPLNNPDLLPEEADSIEVGLQWQPNADHRVQLQLFHTDIKHLITPTYDFNPATPLPYLINKDEAEINGLELGYTGEHEYWYWQANFTLLQAQDGNGRRLDYRPRQKLSLLLGRQVGQGRLQASMVLVSDRLENGHTLAGYGLLNLSASYPLGDGITLFGRIENVTNEDYVLTSGFVAPDGYNTPGRQYFIGLRYAP